LVAFVSDFTGDDDVYIFDPSTKQVINLTHAPGEDRDPVFSVDGQWVIFRSNAGGSWAYHRIALAAGERMRLPGDDRSTSAYRGRFAPLPLPDSVETAIYESYRDGYLTLYAQTTGGQHRPMLSAPANITGTTVSAGNYAPAWRPDGRQIAFTSWRQGRQAIYLADVRGTRAVSLTLPMSSSFDDQDAVWHPDGQRLAFVRWQNHDANLYELDLTTNSVARLTDNPYPDRSPAYAPDGTLFWTRYEPGRPFELHDPFYPGYWRLWMRRPGGREQRVAFPILDMDVHTPAAGLALWPAWTTTEPLPTPTSVPRALVDLVKLDIECAGGDPRINALLADDYAALRQDVLSTSGYDIFGNISDMFRPLGYSTRNYGHLSWHRTGRALDLLFEWHDPPDGPNRFLVVREDLGPQTYWRLYLRTRKQDGTMGEPITVAPWVFWFELDRALEPQAVAAGGKLGQIPSGYYVDLTKLAKRYGWHRIASYQESDFDWKWDSVGREFWHYQRTDGLTWWQAMRQLYPLETLESFYSWTICRTELDLNDPAWLQAKGIPTPTPTLMSNP
jgi:TolB protein